jgi:tetratricopeptide (TPR) repeat protein
MPPVMVAAPRARFGWIAASIGWTLRFSTIVLLLAAILAAAAWPVWRESERLEVEILPIAMPADLAANGLTPEVAANRLIDAMDALLAQLRENDRNRPTRTDLGRIPAYAVTPDRITLRSLASLMRDLLGRPTLRIAGDVIRQGDELQLRLRTPGGRSFATAAVPAETGADKLFQQVAPDAWLRLNPLIVAWHIADSGEPEDRIRPRLVGLTQEQRLLPEMATQITVLYSRSLARSGRAEEALATLEALERRAATQPLLWNVKAQALADLGRADAALEAQKQAVVAEGTTVWSHISSAHLLMKLGRPREALTDLQSARRLAPGNFDAVMLEGMVLLNMGRPVEALALINRVADVRPAMPGLQEALGNALLANGRVDEAMRALETEIARNPSSITARLARANALRAQRKPEEALAAVDDLLRIAPRDGVVISLRGWTLMDLGRHDQALVLFDSLLKDRPNDAAAMHARGVALASLGRRAEAIGAISRAAELQPNNRRYATDLARLRGTPPPGQGAAPAGQGAAPAGQGAAPAGAQRPAPAPAPPAPARP